METKFVHVTLAKNTLQMLASLIFHEFQYVNRKVIFYLSTFVFTIIFVAFSIHFIYFFIYFLFIYLFIKGLAAEKILSELAT